MKNSTISYGKRMFDNGHLYESIVHEVDEKTDPDWDKRSTESKGDPLISPFLSELKQTQSSKMLNSGWRNQQVDNVFRKSRI